MKHLRKLIYNASIGVKLAVLVLSIAFVTLAALTAVIAWMAFATLDAKGEAEIAVRAGQVVTTIKLVQRELRDAAISENKLFADQFREPFALEAGRTIDIAGKAAPVLVTGRRVLDLDFDPVDRFSRATGGVATVFARAGDDFVRVATSLKDEKGERAQGTLLGRTHPAYAAMLAGEPFTGRATLFGREYMAHYRPVKDAAGAVVGILFTAREFTDSLKQLKAAISAEKVGDTGYFFVMDARPGPTLGTFVVHPTREGQNGLAIKDSVTGHEYLKEMLERKRGRIDFSLQDTTRGDSVPRSKIMVFDYEPTWGWVVAGASFASEFTGAAGTLRNRILQLSLGVMVVLGITLMLAIRSMIRRPLAEAVKAAQAVAAGDLTQKIEPRSGDEVGQLLGAMQQMVSKLDGMVGHIRTTSGTVTHAAEELASGNADLSRRTEADAASLEETASSMEELTATVQQTADRARQANRLAIGASEVAAKGGAVVRGVVTTMTSITASSHRIADIIGVIDGIAFQTNILALNAAVEAARAGEQGRGFAVVATEVRSLAQRSAEAAREIKGLIGDSVAKVDEGSAMVAEAGTTIDAIVQAVRQVTDIMADITSATDEQSAGIAQVNQAVMQMDAATQQNASLVEEASAAAASLKDAAHELAAEVAAFKVDDDPAAGTGVHGARAMAANVVETARRRSAASVAPRRNRVGPAAAPAKS